MAKHVQNTQFFLQELVNTCHENLMAETPKRKAASFRWSPGIRGGREGCECPLGRKDKDERVKGRLTAQGIRMCSLVHEAGAGTRAVVCAE